MSCVGGFSNSFWSLGFMGQLCFQVDAMQHMQGHGLLQEELDLRVLWILYVSRHST